MPGVFVIHHMKRSGGHAVIEWIVDNMSGAAFVNNAVPVQPILAGRRPVPQHAPPFAEWLAERRRRGILPDTGAEPAALVVSLEDQELRVQPFEHAGARRLVLVRHPRNLFASRIRRAAATPLLAYRLDDRGVRERTIRVWKEHARAALAPAGGEPLAIFYDAWLTGREYRAKLAQEMGLATCRDPSQRVPSEGSGSSFGGGEVNAVDLQRRADLLSEAEKPILAAIMADREMSELAAQIAAEVTRLAALPARADRLAE